MGKLNLIKQTSFFKCSSLFLFSALLLFFSCAKQAGVSKEEASPLFAKVSRLKEDTAWAYEIEGDRLSKKISSMPSIAGSIPLSPEALVALDGGFGISGIFPELKGFGSLDTTDLNGALLTLVNGFSSALVSEFNGEDSAKIDSYWADETLYSLALFLSDTGKSGYTDFLVGRPFLGEDLIEIPVRWTLKDGKKIYTKIYPVEKNEVWKIQQIEIYRTEE